MPGAAVGYPAAAGPHQAAFGGDGDGAGVAPPGLQRLRDEPLVVSRLAIIEAIRVGGVE